MGRKKPPSLTADPPPGGEKGRTSDVVERSFEIEEEFDLAALGFGVEPEPSFITKEPKAERKDARINKTKGRSAAAQLSTAADLSKNDSDSLEAYSEVPKADLTVHDIGRSNPWVTNIAQAGDDHEKARPEDGDRVKEKDFGKDGAVASPEKGAHTGKELSGLSVAKQASGGVAEVVDSDNAALSFDPAEKAGLSHKGEMSIPVDIIIDTNVTRDAGLEGGIPMSRNTSAGTGIMTGTETISTQQSNTDLKPSLAKARTYRARLVLDKRPGRKVHRLAIRVTRRPDPSAVPPAPRLSRKATPPPSVPPPPSELTKDIADTFSRATLDEITAFGKSYNTNGHLLPIVLRDFFPSIVDRQNAVALANEVRTHLHLPLLSARTDRVALQKALAKMRERVYVELYAGLCLPLAPAPTTKSGKEEEGEGDGVEKPSLSLTPSSLHHLSINLPLAFPQEKAAIKAVFQKGGEYGEKGDVVWQAGVGRMAKGNPRSDIGYRGELAEGEGGVHVFVDYSNILHGLLHALYSDPRPLPPRHARILSLPCLSLLLTRGRPISPGSLHLVASSPLHQNMDALVRLGWEVSVLKRVEIYEAEVMDYEAGKLVPRPTKGVVDRPGTGVGIAAAAAAGKANGKTNEDGGKQKHTEGKDVSHETIGKGGGKADEEDKASKDRADMLKPGKGKAKKKAKGGEKAEIGPTKEAGDTNASAIDVGREAAAAAPRPAPLPPPPPPPGPAPGMRRYKEQGVDEILTLKLLQTIYAKDLDTTPTILHPPIQINGTASSAGDHQPTPLINGHTPHTTPTKRPKPIGTIVLATGDARGGQFNATGFLGAVRHAIKRGWAVELWSFSSGMSRAWRETAKREQWDGRFKMYTMDEWKEWLVDVKEDLAD